MRSLIFLPFVVAACFFSCSESEFTAKEATQKSRNQGATSKPTPPPGGPGVNQSDDLDVGNKTGDRIDNIGTNPGGTIMGSGGKTYLDRCRDDAVSEAVTISFPAIGSGCPFGTNGNGGDSKDVRPTARNERRFDVLLPDDTDKVCAISLNAASQTIEFDDGLIITLNELVIGANGFVKDHFANHLQDVGDEIYRYEWPNLIYEGYQKNSKYCSNFTTCNIPVSEQPGGISLNITSEWFEKSGVLEQINTDKKFSMGSTVTGNHQSSDCKHTAFSVTGSISYLPK